MIFSLPSSPSPSLLLVRSPFPHRPSIPKTLDCRSRKPKQRRIGRCRAELAQDWPFAAAIGACVLNSLIFPLPLHPDETEDGAAGSPIDSTDTRFAVMGLVSFVPYFNWLSWVFAWLDTSDQRYLVYSLVYLAPYFRTNLSLSPEESWLPIASIVICIAHVQLEASIKNGDIKTTELLGEFLKFFSSASIKKDEHFQDRQTVSEKVSAYGLHLISCLLHKKAMKASLEVRAFRQGNQIAQNSIRMVMRIKGKTKSLKGILPFDTLGTGL
ncbi:hypothetical protein ACLOJK_004951 [Asimina triloba]